MWWELPYNQRMPTFATLVGHSRAVAALRRQLERDRVGQAYWITGPEQVGKTTLARGLAAAVLGLTSVRQLDAHPDFWVDDEEGSCKLERIRGGEVGPLGPSLQHVLSLTPFAGGRRAVLIANADRLTDEAANSLLRLLEEPPPGTVILLTTARPQHDHLPPTLPSRCQPLPLGPVPAAAIAAWLGARPDVDLRGVGTAVALADGRPGRALALAVDRAATAAAESRVDRLLAGAGQGVDGWLELAADFGGDTESARAAGRSWAAFLRDACRIAAGAPELAVWTRVQQPAAEWAAALGLPGCLARLDEVREGLDRLAGNAGARLTLDRMLLRCLPDVPSVPSLPLLATAASPAGG